MIVQALTLAFALAAAAPAGMSWIYSGVYPDAQTARLAFGVPDTEDALATIGCASHSRRITINTWADTAAQGVIAELEAGGHSARQGSKVEPNDISEGVFVETTVETGDPVIQAFRAGAPLTIKVGRHLTRLPPLDPKAGAAFFRFCG